MDISLTADAVLAYSIPVIISTAKSAVGDMPTDLPSYSFNDVALVQKRCYDYMVSNLGNELLLVACFYGTE